MERPPAIETPRMRRQLRLLAALAGFVALVIVIAFVGAFRNQGAHSHVPTEVRINTSRLVENAVQANTVETDVTLGGQHYERVPILVARTGGQVHVYWAHSTRNGCLVEPTPAVTKSGGRFVETCGSAQWAIDGRCASSLCSRALDEFAVSERDGFTYAELRALLPRQS